MNWETPICFPQVLIGFLCKQPFCSVLNRNDCEIKYASLKDIMLVIGLLAQSVSGKSSIVFRVQHWDNMVVTHPAFIWTFMWIDFSSHFRLVSGVQQMKRCGEGKGQWGAEMKANSWGGRSVTRGSVLWQITGNAFRLCVEGSHRGCMWNSSLTSTWEDFKARYARLISVRALGGPNTILLQGSDN